MVFKGEVAVAAPVYGVKERLLVSNSSGMPFSLSQPFSSTTRTVGLYRRPDGLRPIPAIPRPSLNIVVRRRAFVRLPSTAFDNPGGPRISGKERSPRSLRSTRTSWDA